MKKRIVASLFAVLLSAAAPGGFVFAQASAQPAQAPQANTGAIGANRFGLPDFGDLVEQVGPAVVNINVVQQRPSRSNEEMPFGDDPFHDFLRRFGVPVPGMPGMPPRIDRGIGSGFIVSPDGYVLTNAHVAGDGDAEVTVTLTDKREFKATVIGRDTRTDIAVLKIDARNLPVVKIGNPERVRVGEWVIAVGSPFGFDNTVTAGIISAKTRRLPDESYVPFLQTDVAINPGNSGGPLFNLAGEVVGINSQIYSRSGGFMGISFAIPIDVAMTVKNQLIAHGRVQRGRLGVTIQPVDKDLAQSFGLSDARGALVSGVEPASAADKAGFKPGDIVLGVDGARVDESVDLPRIIGDKRPGTRIRLDVWRDGKSRELTATLDELTQEAASPRPARGGGGSANEGGGKLGLNARPLSKQDATRLGIAGGLMVESVSGPAARAGVQRGDIILSVNNQPVSSSEQLRQQIGAAGDRFALLILRDDARIFVPMRVK